MRQKVKRLPDEIKIQVVQDYLSGNFTQQELMLKYNFRGKHCVTNWIRKFGVEKPTIQPPMLKQLKSTESDSSKDLKIKRLEEELKREQFKTLALNTMINIAERELKIDIRKKSGAKR
ncbi:MAG: transposase [Paludibacteraceae bacterium]